MSEHTPTPWSWHIQEGPSAVLAPEGWIICTTSSDENAAFIVKAVNSHDALVKVLEDVVRDINDYERANNLAPNPGRTECWDSVAYAKAVLASIKGRP